jgi:hypothetical protein
MKENEMIYFEWSFDISEAGLKLTDRADPNETYQVQIRNTPLKVGDTFTLELDKDNCMFFRKDAVQPPRQLELEW